MKAFFSVLIGAGIWGSTGVFVKTLPLSVPVFCSLRTIVPALLAGLILLLTGRAAALLKGNRKLYLASLLNAVRLVFYYHAMLLGTIGNVVITLYTWPLLVVLFNAVLLRRKPSRRLLLATTMAFVGMSVVVANSKSTAFNPAELTGIGLMFLCSITTAVFVIVFKRTTKNLNAVESIYYQNIGGVLFLLFLGFGSASSVASVAPQDLATGVFYSALVGFGGFAFFFYGLKKLPDDVASSLTFFEVFSSMLLGAIFLGESITASMVFGALLIIASGILIQRES